MQEFRWNRFDETGKVQTVCAGMSNRPVFPMQRTDNCWMCHNRNKCERSRSTYSYFWILAWLDRSIYEWICSPIKSNNRVNLTKKKPTTPWKDTVNKCFPVGLVVVVTLFPLNTVKAVEGKQRAKMTMTMAMIVATLLPLKAVVTEEGKQRAAAISSLSFRQVQVPKTSCLHLILALLLSAFLPFLPPIL